MAQMTIDRFAALAELIKATPGSDSYEMAKLVLVDGRETGDAARELGKTYNAAHQAVARYRRGLELAKVVAGTQ